jgi:hypothetical protein
MESVFTAERFASIHFFRWDCEFSCVRSYRDISRDGCRIVLLTLPNNLCYQSQLILLDDIGIHVFKGSGELVLFHQFNAG